MWNLLKLELGSSRFKWANIIVVLIIIFKIVLISIFKNSEHIYINEINTGAFLLLVFYFMDTQSDKTDIIMNSIPIDKRNLVLSKYMILLIIFVISLIYTVSYFWILRLLGFWNSNFITPKDIIIAFSIYIIHSSLLLPIYHISPRGLFYSFIYISYLVERRIDRSNVIDSIRLFIGKNTLILFLTSLAIMVISILISYHNYNKREFVRG